MLLPPRAPGSPDHDLHTSPPAVRRSLIPWSLRFVLAATVSDARGSRVLLRHGLGGTKPARRHRTTGGIFIRLGWALKEPMAHSTGRCNTLAPDIWQKGGACRYEGEA